MLRLLSSIVIGLFAISLLGDVGCGVSTVDSQVRSSAEVAASKKTSIQVVDRLNRNVTFHQPPQRIVSISPETTELLFALGLGDRMVGVTEHCNYPEEAKQVAKVGIGTVETISRERIIAVRPDAIFCRWDNHEPLIDTFERLNIPIVGMGSESLQGLFEETRLIGRITDHLLQAETLVKQMEQRLSSLQQRVPNQHGRTKPTVFYQLYDDPLMTVTSGSFIGQMLTLAGLQNIIDEGPNRYPTVNAEVIIARDPQIILMAATKSSSDRMEAIMNRPGWKQISAVKNRRIYNISGDEISRCGPRLLDALEQIIDHVHAETD